MELERPESVIGRDTIGSIQSGIVHGYAGLVDSLVKKISNEGGKGRYVVATGGLAQVIAGESKTINKVLPDLTLEGLRILWERNQ